MGRRPFHSAALVLLVLVACDGHAVPVEIRFAAKVGSEPFACTKTYAEVGATQGTLEPLDFRLYVHDVRLVDTTGGTWPVTLEQDGLWQTASTALLDFEDDTGTCSNGTLLTNTSVRGTYDTGHEETTMTGLALTVGVPFDLNHADVAQAPSPLNLSGLFWNWQTGYKFVRIDMKVAGGSGVNLHLGSLGCELDPESSKVARCAAPNRPQVTLTDFDPDTDTVVIDYAAMVAGLDLANDQGAAPGCMSGAEDPECAVIFEHLGLDITTGLPRAGQSAFRVE